ncbi:hypothetical protein ACFFGT_20825 [Mucilaginibacter angelicae]|uniref:DUF4234 domain-containing protein n=1 Tax=Mucilaginibacter angelicae TaxID=869718 RepID=A0ABV6LB59_9SPHI
MPIRLTPLRTVLLFAPFIITCILGRIQYSELQTFIKTYYISDNLSAFNFLLLIGLQSYLLIRFNDTVVKKLTFFKVNALIPVIYTGYWFICGVYQSITKPNYPKLGRPQSGPVSLVALNAYQTIIALLLFYSLLTFFFTNNYYVSKQIKKINDPTDQAALTNEFLNPMRLIVKASWIAIVILFAFAFVNDILAMLKL